MKQESKQYSTEACELKRKGKAKAIQMRNTRRLTSRIPELLPLHKIDDQAATFDGSIQSCQCSTIKGLCSPFESTIGSSQEDTKEPTKNEVMKKSKFIRMYHENTRKYQNFKVFDEKDIPINLGTFRRKKPKELEYDDDCMTDDEQIKSAMKKVNEGLKEALSQFLKDGSGVENVERYHSTQEDI